MAPDDPEPPEALAHDETQDAQVFTIPEPPEPPEQPEQPEPAPEQSEPAQLSPQPPERLLPGVNYSR